tara:strand:+ start:222 stop:473 length:252 start_codon:yes stop_codon:yes gene_type:complete
VRRAVQAVVVALTTRPTVLGQLQAVPETKAATVAATGAQVLFVQAAAVVVVASTTVRFSEAMGRMLQVLQRAALVRQVWRFQL